MASASVPVSVSERSARCRPRSGPAKKSRFCGSAATPCSHVAPFGSFVTALSTFMRRSSAAAAGAVTHATATRATSERTRRARIVKLIDQRHPPP
jgi:hypothetical protein